MHRLPVALTTVSSSVPNKVLQNRVRFTTWKKIKKGEKVLKVSILKSAGRPVSSLKTFWFFQAARFQAPRAATSSSTTSLRSLGIRSWCRCLCRLGTSSAAKSLLTELLIRANASVSTNTCYFAFRNWKILNKFSSRNKSLRKYLNVYLNTLSNILIIL